MYNGHLSVTEIDLHEKDRRILSEKVVLRTFRSEGVTRHEVDTARLRGVIFKPKGNGPFKGIVLMILIFFQLKTWP